MLKCLFPHVFELISYKATAAPRRTAATEQPPSLLKKSAFLPLFSFFYGFLHLLLFYCFNWDVGVLWESLRSLRWIGGTRHQWWIDQGTGRKRGHGVSRVTSCSRWPQLNPGGQRVSVLLVDYRCSCMTAVSKCFRYITDCISIESHTHTHTLIYLFKGFNRFGPGRQGRRLPLATSPSWPTALPEGKRPRHPGWSAV